MINSRKEKDMKSLKIIFMGTPDFSVPMLDVLHKSIHEIIGVVTVADKPSGRGQKINTSAIKKYAEKNNLKLLQPLNLKEQSFIKKLKNLNADLFVVVAFRMLPEIVWKLPSLGTINLHASLLPQYRGAAPINWAIINGEKETGVTTFFIEKEIDTGKIIDQLKTEISFDMTAGDLYLELMNLGEELILKTVNNISKNQIEPIPQKIIDSQALKNAPKIFKEDCYIDWRNNALDIYNKIRGLSPYPGAKCTLLNIKKQKYFMFKLLESNITEIPVNKKEILTSNNHGILIACKDMYIQLTKVQLEGKKAMNYKEFLAGNNLSDWRIQNPSI